MSGPDPGRRALLKGLALGALGLGGGIAAWRTLAPSPRRPNVLFILADQHNAGALGCDGNREIETPNLDRLAREGVLFERAFCQSAQCKPSRFSIWTGRYARSHGVTVNRALPNLEERTVGDLFAAAGYVTGTIGKNHMNLDEIGETLGFQTVIDRPDYLEFVRAEGAPLFDVEGDWLSEEIQPGLSNVGASAADNEHHPIGFWTDQTIAFLRRHRHEPFCLWYSFYAPHTPITPSRPWATMYDPQSLTLPPNHDYPVDERVPLLAWVREKSGDIGEAEHRRILAYYYGLVSQLDHNVGRVLQELDALDLSRDTIVVYTSDHGELMGSHGAWTKSLQGYDATLRVPLILRLPGVLPAGERIESLVGSIDLLPTLLDLTHQPIPPEIQGRSLVPLIRDAHVEWRDYIVSEIGDEAGDLTAITVREPTKKYVLYRRGGRDLYEQFFDLSSDPWEMDNRIADPARLADIERLRTELGDWERQTARVTPRIRERGQGPRKQERGRRRRPGAAAPSSGVD